MNVFDPSDEERAGWEAWLAERPEAVRKVAEKLPPWKLYRLHDSGHRVTLRSIDEGEDDSVTLTVTVSAQFNLIAFERNVFGIKPEDLTECDLPGPDEPVGAAVNGLESIMSVNERAAAEREAERREQN